MSLPSKIIFYNDFGLPFDDEFINVGWFINAKSITRELKSLELIFKSKNYSFVWCYESLISKEFVEYILDNYEQLKINKDLESWYKENIGEY